LTVAAVTGGTATHLALLDLHTKNLTGNIARSREHHLQQNGVPFDPQ
jgi:glycine/serine hydroxymethyltransferase